MASHPRESLLAAGATAGAALASFLTLDPATALASSAFAGLVAAAAANDIAEYRLPDAITAALLVLGLGYSLFEACGALSALVEPLARAAIVGLLMMALRRLYLALRGRSGLGLGDVKLAVAAAVWLPAELVAWALLIASVAALLLVLLLRLLDGREAPDDPLIIPFGAFLGPAAWLVWYLALLIRVV